MNTHPAGAIGEGRESPKLSISSPVDAVPQLSSESSAWAGPNSMYASSPPTHTKIFKSYNPGADLNGDITPNFGDHFAPSQFGDPSSSSQSVPMLHAEVPLHGDSHMLLSMDQMQHPQGLPMPTMNGSSPAQGPSFAYSGPSGNDLSYNQLHHTSLGGHVQQSPPYGYNHAGGPPQHMQAPSMSHMPPFPPPVDGVPYSGALNHSGPFQPPRSDGPPSNGILPGQETSFVHVANGAAGPDPRDSRTLTGGRLFPSAGVNGSPFGVTNGDSGYVRRSRPPYKPHGGPRSNGYQRSYTAAKARALTVREFNRRISICARKRDIAGAMAALQELDRSPTLSRNLFTYNAVINALVMCGQYPRALDFWKEMRAVNIKPNLVTYNTMMKSCFGGKEEDVNRAFALLQEMERDGIEPDQVTFNSLINACVSAGRIHLVEQAYGDMIKRKIYPDDFTFTTLSKAGVAMNDINMLDDLLLHQLKHHTHSRFIIPSSTPRKGRGKNSGELSPVAYNTIADGYIRCGFPDRALELLGRLHKPRPTVVPPPDAIPVAPDVQTFNVRLKALRESRAPSLAAFETLEDMRCHGLDPDHITLLTLADLCCRRRDMALAESVLHIAYESDIRNCQNNPAEWNPYCRREGRNRSIPSRNRYTKRREGGPSARRNSNQPRSAKCNASLFNSLIRGYTSLHDPDVEAAMALYSHMVSFVEEWGFDWYAPDSVTFTMLVDGYARKGDFPNATRIVEEMERAGRQNVVAYNAYIKSNRGNGSEMALSILERIKTAKLVPDVVTYNTILDLFTSEEDGLERAEALVLNDMTQYGIKPDMHTYNTLIKGAARSGPNGLNAAYRWLRELEDNGYSADEFTYQSMVSACAAAGDATRALDFFHKCEEERAKRVFNSSGSGSRGRRAAEFNLLPHPAAYIALMRAYLTSNKESGIGKVLSLRDEMLERGLVLGRAGHTAVADAYAEVGDYEKVERTLNAMLEEEKKDAAKGRTSKVTGFAAVHYSIRMKALSKAGELDHAIELLEEMKREDITCDAAVFNVLLFACARAEDLDRMVFVLRRMEAAGVEPDASTTRAFASLIEDMPKTLGSFQENFRDAILKYTPQPGVVSVDSPAPEELEVGEAGIETK